jgi:hypothetical protein
MKPWKQLTTGERCERLYSEKTKIRVRKTPNCAHAYKATVSGIGFYGWGNTPQAAREKLIEQVERHWQDINRTINICKAVLGR